MNEQTNETQNNLNADESAAQTATEHDAEMQAAGEAEDVSLDFEQLQENPVNALEDENGRLKDQLLRTVAEMENVRRRAAEDVSKAHKFAIEKFAESLVPVQDSLEKALQDQSGDINTLREGVDLTFKQLVQALEKGGVVAVDPKGEKFDPHFHQAISMIPSDQPSGTVVEVLQKGFKISDRVIRPALVIVAQ